VLERNKKWREGVVLARGGRNNRAEQKKTGRGYNLTLAAHLRRAIVMAVPRLRRALLLMLRRRRSRRLEA
jgi:hypothetical protein